MDVMVTRITSKVQKIVKTSAESEDVLMEVNPSEMYPPINSRSALNLRNVQQHMNVLQSTSTEMLLKDAVQPSLTFVHFLLSKEINARRFPLLASTSISSLKSVQISHSMVATEM